MREGDIVDAVVFKITDFGAFCNLRENKRGLIHISQVADEFVKDVADHLKVGDQVKARVLRVTPEGKIDLSLKNAAPAPAPSNGSFNGFFEEKLKKFLKESGDKITEVQKHIDAKQK